MTSAVSYEPFVTSNLNKFFDHVDQRFAGKKGAEGNRGRKRQGRNICSHAEFLKLGQLSTLRRLVLTYILTLS